MKPNLTVCCLVVALIAAPSVVATPISGMAQVTAIASIDGGPSQIDSQSASVTWLSAPVGVGASSSAFVTDSSGHTASAGGHVSAQWLTNFYPDGSRGRWWANYAWYVEGSFTGDIGFTGPEWTYTFQADSDASFNLGGSISLYDSEDNRVVTPQPNLVVNYEIVTNIPGLSGFIDPFDISSNIWSGDVIAGEIYTISVYNRTRVTGAIDPFFSSSIAEFAFEQGPPLNTVPETASSVSLLSLGFGVLALFGRRIRLAR